MWKFESSRAHKKPSAISRGIFFDSETDFETNLGLIGLTTTENVQQKSLYPYELASLKDASGDLQKRWCITFRAFDTSTGNLRRKQVWIPAACKTKSDRLKYAKSAIKEINHLLAKGFHFGKALSKPKVITGNILTLDKAFDWVYDHREASLRKRSIQSIKLIKVELKEWLKIHDLEFMPLQAVTHDHCDDFMQHLRKKRKIGNVTFNNYLGFFKWTFNYLVDQGKLDKSPADKLKAVKTEESEKVSFPKDIKSQLLEAYQEKDPALHIFAQYIYYTFIRPTELRKLQVRHVMDKTIFIPGNISKNKKSEHVLITPAMEKLLEKLEVRKYPAHYYLIGLEGKPSKKGVSHNHFTNHHLKIRKELKLMTNYTLYCWKHTGVVDTYLATLDLEFVSRHCRHSSLDMTKRYLRGLGLMTEYHQQHQLPDLGM
ncbi:tyrosine-type recombinase/integrase [Belliella pelovolcani]|uniref:tyrosine-type recombinase/integrase n=1 Tax=Belliella pelovolcani TaxID=529505 RepID=UPI00391CA2F5